MKPMWIILLCIASSPAVFADTMTLNSGAELNGVVVQKSADAVTFRIEGGEITLPLAMVQKIDTGGETLANIESLESKTREKLAVANAERQSRMLQYVSGLEETRNADVVRPASFRRDEAQTSKMQSQTLDDLVAGISTKLDLYRELVREIRGSGLPESQRLRDAVLSDLFPNYRGPAIVW